MTNPSAEVLLSPVRPNNRTILNPAFAPFIFVLPLIFLTLAFVIFPALMTVGLMFFDVGILAGKTEWVGLRNLDRAISRGEIANSLWVTALYALMTVIPSVFFGLLAAIAINALTRGAAFRRAVYFMPVAATFHRTTW